jgi:hypothetical protein
VSARSSRVAAFVAALLLVACNDVGDDSAATPPGGETSDVDAAADAAVPTTPTDATVAVDAPLDDATAPDAEQPDTAVPVDATDATPGVDAADASTADAADAADAEVSETSTVDAGTDTGAGDASVGPGPCTAAGQTGCVACSGNADGVCTPTEALFVAHDIRAGHAATLDCYSCLFNNSCVNDTTFSDKGHECGDLSGAFGGGGSASDLCVATLTCILKTSCAAGDVQDCFCGADHPGNSCQTAANPDGACKAAEVAGLGVSDDTSVLKDYTDTTRPAGMANQILSCAKINNCTACP